MDELKYKDGKFTVNGIDINSISAITEAVEIAQTISANTQQFSVFDDPEGRTEITTDAENKILGYRDSKGTRHEHKISAKHLELSDEAATEVSKAFKSAGIKMENPSDFSKDSHIELPIPRIAAQVRIYAPKLPNTKQDDIEAEIEYNDKDGNYFRKPVILNAQGSSSMNFYVKNMAIDVNDGSKIKFGDFPAQDSFHLKKYYIDAFRGQCIVGYWLMDEVYKSRPIAEQYPYDYLLKNSDVYSSNGKVSQDFFTGAKCHPDGFPVSLIFVNQYTKEETDMGIFAWNLKKSKEVYKMDKNESNNIILDGEIAIDTIFNGIIKWNMFEIRNPKSLKDIDGNKYDGDNPKELSETDSLSKKVKDNITRLSGVVAALKENNTKETFEKYFLVPSFIDYYLVSQLLYNFDGFRKNWIWCCWDGQHWTPTLYDVDSIFDAMTDGTCILEESETKLLGEVECMGLTTLYETEIKQRYAELRKANIFDASHITDLLNKWILQVGYDNISNDLSIFNDTPSYRDGKINKGWRCIDAAARGNSSIEEYSDSKQYNAGDKCAYLGMIYKATQQTIGVAPTKGSYPRKPIAGGFFNSPQRVNNWLIKRIELLDNTFNYNL